jgi:hypothetical protein
MIRNDDQQVSCLFGNFNQRRQMMSQRLGPPCQTPVMATSEGEIGGDALNFRRRCFRNLTRHNICYRTLNNYGH